MSKLSRHSLHRIKRRIHLHLLHPPLTQRINQIHDLVCVVDELFLGVALEVLDDGLFEALEELDLLFVAFEFLQYSGLFLFELELELLEEV